MELQTEKIPLQKKILSMKLGFPESITYEFPCKTSQYGCFAGEAEIMDGGIQDTFEKQARRRRTASHGRMKNGRLALRWSSKTVR